MIVVHCDYSEEDQKGIFKNKWKNKKLHLRKMELLVGLF